MNDVLASLNVAHQQIKNLAIQHIQADQEIPMHIIDTIKSLYTLIQAVKQVTQV